MNISLSLHSNFREITFKRGFRIRYGVRKRAINKMLKSIAHRFMPVNHVCAMLCKLQYRSIVHVLRINSGYFVPSNNYWSSTDNSTNPTTNAAIWNFNGSGNTNNNNKTNSNTNIYTRCVRT